MIPPHSLKILGLLFLLVLCLVAFGAMVYGTSSRFDNYGYVTIHGRVVGYVAYPSSCNGAQQCYNVYVELNYASSNNSSSNCLLETVVLAVNETAEFLCHQ